jgi:hypothetical protein
MAMLSTLMVGTQQVHEINDIQMGNDKVNKA